MPNDVLLEQREYGAAHSLFQHPYRSLPLTIPTPTTTSTLAHLTPLCPKSAASQKFCTCKKLAVIYTYEVLLVYSREPAAAAVEFEYINSLANFQFTLYDTLSFIHTTNRQVSEKLMLYQAVYRKYRSIYILLISKSINLSMRKNIFTSLRKFLVPALYVPIMYASIWVRCSIENYTSQSRASENYKFRLEERSTIVNFESREMEILPRSFSYKDRPVFICKFLRLRIDSVVGKGMCTRVYTDATFKKHFLRE